jgi:hypothetical protein
MRSSLLLILYSAAMFAETVAGLQWTPPAGWKSSGTTQMRAATYAVDGAECVVYFFGAGQGGSVQANLDRWKGQFKNASGAPADAKIRKLAAHHLPVTIIDVAGEYSGMGGPMAQSPAPVKDYRLLGAIVEGSGGNVFIKFTGPLKAVTANQNKFEQLVQSFDQTH